MIRRFRFIGRGGAHLDAAEYVDFLDGVLPPDRLRHVQQCDACRAEALELSSTLHGAADLSAPEPEPAFWDDLSARVQRAIAEEPPPSRVVRLVLPPRRRAALAAAASVVLGVLIWRGVGPDGGAGQPPPDRPSPASTVTAHTVDEVPLDAIEADAAWDVVLAVADDLPVDAVDAEWGSMRAGSADGLAHWLTAEERAELVRLIEDAMRQPPPGSSS